MRSPIGRAAASATTHRVPVPLEASEVSTLRRRSPTGTRPAPRGRCRALIAWVTVLIVTRLGGRRSREPSHRRALSAPVCYAHTRSADRRRVRHLGRHRARPHHHGHRCAGHPPPARCARASRIPGSSGATALPPSAITSARAGPTTRPRTVGPGERAGRPRLHRCSPHPGAAAVKHLSGWKAPQPASGFAYSTPSDQMYRVPPHRAADWTSGKKPRPSRFALVLHSTGTPLSSP